MYALQNVFDALSGMEVAEWQTVCLQNLDRGKRKLLINYYINVTSINCDIILTNY